MENYMQRSDIACWAVLPIRLLVGYGFIGHGFPNLSRGHGWFCRCFAATRRATPTHSNMADDQHGACCVLGFVAWSIRSLGEHSRGFGFASRYVYCPSAVRI